RLVLAFAAPELGELERAHTEIGFEPLALNLSASRGRETRRGQTDRSATGQRDQAFDRALAETLGAERHCPLIVLQGAGHEFCLPCRAAIDQRDDRQTLGEVTRSRTDAFGV